MKKILTLICFLTIATGSFSQETDHRPKVKQEAETMAALLVAENYKEFCKYSHPKIIEMMDGAENMASFLEKNAAEMKAGGISFRQITIGTASPVMEHQGWLQCTIPQNLTLKVEGGRFEQTATLIAVSMNNGESWYFIDAAPGLQKIREQLPQISEKLVIPVASEGVLTEEK